MVTIIVLPPLRPPARIRGRSTIAPVDSPLIPIARPREDDRRPRVPMSFSKSGTYCFGPYTVDLRAHSLMRDGVRIPVQEQPFQILLALLESPGRIVTREDLRRRLWGDEIFVDFNQSMNSAVRRLRVALDDNPKAPTFVETVPRIGFRLVAEVEVVQPLTPIFPQSSVRRHSFSFDRLSALLAHAAPRIQLTISTAAIFSIAMLLGLSLAARARLTGARTVQAGSLTSPTPGHPSPVIPISAAPESLSANTPADLAYLPSSTGCRDDADHANCSASAASLPFKKEAAGGIPSSPAKNNAVDLANLEGRYLLSLRNQESYAHASLAFHRALAVDPRSASALVGLAQVNVLLSLEGVQTDQHLEAASSYATRALQVNPRMASAQAALAAVNVLKDWNWSAGDKAFQHAIALDPSDNLTHLWYATFVLLPQKRYAQAEQQVLSAIRLDPFSLTAQTNLGWVYFKEGRDRAASDQFHLVLRMNPTFVPARFHMAQLLHKEGRNAEAAQFEPSDPMAAARQRSVAGLHGNAADTCRQVVDALAKPSGKTFSTLQAGFTHHCPAVLYMDQDSGLATLQQDARFAELMQSLQVPRK